MPHQALISTRKGLFELEQDKGAWRITNSNFLGEPVSMSLYDRRDGTLYAALNLGHFGVKMHRRDPGSSMWTEIAVPTYPTQPEDRKGDPFPWKLKMIWSLECGGPDQPGVLWAGTLPGGLFRSNDRGNSWQLVESLWNVTERTEWFGGGYDEPGIHSICVDPRDSKRILIGISSGGVWVSDDDGISWTVRTSGMRADYMPPEQAEQPQSQDPHRIVQCPSMPDALWCQHHNGIWRTTDYAAKWERLKPQAADTSDFGFAVAVHPQDPDRAWFVPAGADQRRVPVNAALSVTRTRDGGKSFEVLRNGLPQEHCYDLIYRHGLALADDGENLLMGSTSGNVWASTNGGDAWQEVSSCLPPIYAIQFV